MLRGICKWMGLGACALAATLSSKPAAATPTYGWVFHNTSWYDFDVGGHVMCGILWDNVPPHSYLPQTRVICEPSGGAMPQWPNSPNAAGLKAIAVDDDGRPWVLTNDSYIYRGEALPDPASLSNNTWHYWHGPYGVVSGGCGDQIAVTGSVAAGTTHVMLRGCTDHSAYLFVESQNTWIVTQTNVLEISTGGQPHTGTGSVFWELSSAAMPNNVMVYDPARAASIGLSTGYGAAVVIPSTCYGNEPFDQVAAPGCTPALSPTARHLGGHEIVLDGTWPQVVASEPPVYCTGNTRRDAASPTGWSFDILHPTPWFAQYVMIGPWTVNGSSFYTHTFEPIGPYVIDLPTVQARRFPSWIWKGLVSGLTDPNLQVCGNLSPPDYGNWSLSDTGQIIRPVITKIREGSQYGRAGGFVSTSGATDVLWIRDNSARVYSYEGG
jgi:hypothetical protein